MSTMGRFSLKEFVHTTGEKDRGQGHFELESDRMLEVNLKGLVWMKMGSMVAYRGPIKFTREGILETGLGEAMKKFFTGEGARLTKAQGEGKLYLADSGKKISILNLDNESIYINGNDLLAFQDGLTWQVRMMRKLTSVVAGGLFNVLISGRGMVAITTHYDPLTLPVTKGSPVTTDPNATVAWSGSLTPEFKADISLKTFFGRGSGDSIQMSFSGEGFVVVQPYEEVSLQRQTGGLG